MHNVEVQWVWVASTIDWSSYAFKSSYDLYNSNPCSTTYSSTHAVDPHESSSSPTIPECLCSFDSNLPPTIPYSDSQLPKLIQPLSYSRLEFYKCACSPSSRASFRQDPISSPSFTNERASSAAIHEFILPQWAHPALSTYSFNENLQRRTRSPRYRRSS